MHIAIYAPIFVRPTETFIYNATQTLVKAGITVSVLAACRQTEDQCPFEPVRIVPEPGRWHPKRLARRVLQPLLGAPPGGIQTDLHRRALTRELAEIGPDILLANYGPSGVLLAPIAEKLQIPLVVSFHGVDASSLPHDPLWRRQYREMFAVASAATGPSHYVRNKLVTLGCPDERAHVLHYGIKTDEIRFTPPTGRYDGREIRYLFVGRLTEKKDPISLLQSFAKANRRLSPLKSALTMAGDGPLRADVEAEISRLQLQESVRLLGRVTHEEVIKLYETAHIYVQHSVTAPNGDEEGLPVSITEALAAGLPVISTRHSGIPEAVIDGQTGLLVDEKDVDGMADAMVSLAGDPGRWRQFADSGRKLLEDEFSVPIVQENMLRILDAATTAAKRTC